MEPRERVIAALNHEKPDRIPRDVGSLPVTGIHAKAYENYLRNYSPEDLEDKSIEIYDVTQQLAKPHEETLKKWRIDTRGVSARPGSGWSLEIKEGDKHHKFTDEWGITWAKPKKSGYYYDIRENPLSGEVEKRDVLEYPWPDPQDESRIEGLSEEIAELNQEKRYFISLTGLGPGIYELAQWLRGYKDLWLDFLRDGELAHLIMEKVTELKLDFWKMALNEVGDLIDTVYMADDIGNQDNLQVSLDTYREFIKPYQKKVFKFIKNEAPSRVFIFYHSDGAIREAIPDLIDAGIDALNPVQVSASGMDPEGLIKEFGDEIAFWGAGANPHGTLLNGNRDEVSREIRSRIDLFDSNGGWVFAPIHNIQPDVEPEKIEAMFETMDTYGA